MAESFIEEIYHRADVIEQLRESCLMAQRMRIQYAGNIWNSVLPTIYKIIETSEDRVIARNIGEASEIVHNAWRDPAFFSAVISEQLIPAVMRYMESYTGIDVTEGRFRIKSSAVGFLTVYDSESNMYLHDPFDPMWSARILAEDLWTADMDEFHLFGSGLGYLPYQLWKVSQQSMKIYVYEPSEQILDYAVHYGVLSRIPEDMLYIISGEKEETVQSYIQNSIGYGKGRYVTLWAGKECEQVDGGHLSNERMNADAERWFRDIWEINMKKNSRHTKVSVQQLKYKLFAKEWIVVAAGPSVDEQIDYLKEIQGKRKIVAVDVILKRLLGAGIIPDLVVTADPQDHMINHLEGIENQTDNIPLLGDRMASWRYVEAYKGEIAFSVASGTVDKYPDYDKSWEVWNYGGTVSSLAIEAAVNFGAEQVNLIGLDLAYPGGNLFAKGTSHADAKQENWGNKVESVDGGMVETSKTFLYFISVIEEQIAMHPNVKFINMSKHGARIKGSL